MQPIILRPTSGKVHPPSRFSLLLVTLIGLAVPVSGVRSSAQTYTLVDLGALGGNFSVGSAINANGNVVGYFAPPGTNSLHAFRGSLSGVLTDLGTFGGLDSEATGINDAGLITGSSDLQGPAQHAFRTTVHGTISDGTATDLGTLGGNISQAASINDSGQVTGGSNLTNFGVMHAFRTTATGKISDPDTDLGVFGSNYLSIGNGISASGQVTGYATLSSGMPAVAHAFRTTATGKITDPDTDLGTLGGSFSTGHAINDSGEVAGYSSLLDGSTHAFLTTATGKISDPGADIGTLGGRYSYAEGINDAGYVVGYSTLADGATVHPFLYTDHMVDLNTLLSPSDAAQWQLLYAYAINARGQITGLGVIGGQQHAFLLSPSLSQAALASIHVYPNLIHGGNDAHGVVHLTSAAPAHGLTVALVSTNPAAQVPGAINVPEGATFATFIVKTHPVSSDKFLQIKAAYHGQTRSATITIVRPILKSTRFLPATLRGSQSATLDIVLSSPAGPKGAHVQLSADDTASIALPHSITIKAGDSGISLSLATTAVHAEKSITVTVTLDASSKTTRLTLIP